MIIVLDKNFIIIFRRTTIITVFTSRSINVIVILSLF